MLTIEDYYSILFPVHAYLGHSIHGFNEIRHSSSVGFCISIEKKSILIICCESWDIFYYIQFMV